MEGTVAGACRETTSPRGKEMTKGPVFVLKPLLPLPPPPVMGRPPDLPLSFEFLPPLSSVRPRIIALTHGPLEEISHLNHSI